MKALPHTPNDPAELRQRIGIERSALQRDRLRVVLLAIEGIDGQELMREEIAKAVGRSRQFVDEWVKRYRLRGLPGLNRLKAKGNPPSLTPEQQASFKARLLAGPTDADGGKCTLRGEDARRILELEMGVALKLSAVYDWMHRIGLSCLRPRPKHRKNQPKVMEQWLLDAPLLSRK